MGISLIWKWQSYSCSAVITYFEKEILAFSTFLRFPIVPYDPTNDSTPWCIWSPQPIYNNIGYIYLYIWTIYIGYIYLFEHSQLLSSLTPIPSHTYQRFTLLKTPLSCITRPKTLKFLHTLLPSSLHITTIISSPISYNKKIPLKIPNSYFLRN